MSCSVGQLVFDLDDTLYPRHSGLMREVGRRILRYMTERLGMPAEEAQLLRDRYVREYGTTMAGLLRHHVLDPDDYLEYVHEIPTESWLKPNPELDLALMGITLPKAIWTNATRDHADRVLAALGIARHFARIIDVRDMGYVSKPAAAIYGQLLEMLDAEASECILVEDSPRNLLPAARLGMTTVLVNEEAQGEADFVISRIEDIGPLVATLLAATSSSDQTAGVAGDLPGDGRLLLRRPLHGAAPERSTIRPGRSLPSPTALHSEPVSGNSGNPHEEDSAV